jgi:hypothetical protein
MAPKWFVIAVMLAPAFAAPALAVEKTKTPPDFLTRAAGTQLEPCSAAQVKAWMMFKVARANVYLPDCEGLNWPFAAPVALRFAYQREVPARGFTESANEMLERNLNEKKFQALEDAIRSFNDAYKEVEDGDTYYMLRTTDGLTLWLEGEELASVQNPELARLYFRIWFGDKPFSDSLRQDLLEPLE